jgi:hypothetical protein
METESPWLSGERLEGDFGPKMAVAVATSPMSRP